MSFRELLLGPPIPTWEEPEHRVTTFAAVPMFGLDALASAAYGPEAAMAVLIPLGTLSSNYVLPITLAVLLILGVLYFSYSQTIRAYPQGGGSYTVASENLGRHAGLFSAAALCVDYLLDVAVGISAGVGAIISVYPALQPYILPLCLGILLVISIVNLRGVRESGIAFVAPTYTFITTLLIVIAMGLWKYFSSGGHPQPIVAPPHAAASVGAVSLWLLLRSFSSGCTAMTGIEAVSNGMPAFEEPTSKHAGRTLTVVVVTLAILLGGVAVLSHAYHITAMDQEKAGYQSVISQMVAAIAGHGWFYLLTMLSVLAVLALSANTGFADFPRLCRLLAEDKFLPRTFADRGPRLVFSKGIVALALLSGLLLIIFHGITDRLIPLFAIGAFGAFTLSQAGMVVHWKRVRSRGWHVSMVINAIGAVSTGIALIVVLVTKFVEGAWVTMVLIPALIFMFTKIRAHYDAVDRETACETPLKIDEMQDPLVLVPMAAWDTIGRKALRFSLLLSHDVRAVYVSIDDDAAKDMKHKWKKLVREPLKGSNLPVPSLVTITSPYRRISGPFLDYVKETREKEDRLLVVVIPELVEAKWYQYFLHNQRAALLKAKLYFQGGKQVVVVNVPWYLGGDEPFGC